MLISPTESELITSSSDSSEIQTNSTLINVVLVAGFESFNKDLYLKAASTLSPPIHLSVFSDSEIRTGAAVGVGGASEENVTNPIFTEAVKNAHVFIGSLIFDYDDVMAVTKLLPYVTGPRLLFECATELMAFNKIGTFTMDPSANGNQPAGPPPAVKAILSKFSSGKEEDKLSGYIKLLKVGPELLKFIPGEKAGDLRAWLELYRYWNQGGLSNVSTMLQLQTLVTVPTLDTDHKQGRRIEFDKLPLLQITPDIGLLHPLKPNSYFASPTEYIQWRESSDCYEAAKNQDHFKLAARDSPRIALLLYRKHVITGQRYIGDLITQMEKENILPIPIFINGVEAHIIVRDLLTSKSEVDSVLNRKIKRDSTYKSDEAVTIDAIVSTIGFPLVGGPGESCLFFRRLEFLFATFHYLFQMYNHCFYYAAGSMEAGRNVAIAEQLLKSKNVPYIIASPLLLQSIPQWKQNGVLGVYLQYRIISLIVDWGYFNIIFIYFYVILIPMNRFTVSCFVFFA